MLLPAILCSSSSRSLKAFVRASLFAGKAENFEPLRHATAASSCGICLPIPVPYEVKGMRLSCGADLYNNNFHDSISSDDKQKAHVNSMIIILNWLHLGKPFAAPMHCVLGQPLSAEQWAAIKRIEFLAGRCLELENVGVKELGRTNGKVESVSHMLVALTSFGCAVGHDFDPYT